MGKKAVAFVWLAMIHVASLAPSISSCGYCPPKRRSTRPAPSFPVPAPPQVSFPPPPAPTCPADGLKIGACVDALGGLVHLGVGDPVVNQCCPVLTGLAELEAALCLCWAIKLKLLSLDVVLPLALELLAACGQNPPPGFACPKS